MRNPFYHRQGITDPRHFYGRGGLVRSLFEMIGSGQSCAVVGERRIGKSSLLSYLGHAEVQAAHHLEPEHTLTAMLDFLALHTYSPQELWLEILETLELETNNRDARKILRTATGRAEVTFADFRRALRKLKRKGFRAVLLCDEFELAVQNPKFDESFFGALRSLAGGEGVVFVTASRLSLLELEQYRDEEVRRKVLGSPFFNIFAEFSVGPFQDFEVAEMLAGSLDETTIRFEREDVAFFGRVAGRHPYFLQLAAYHLYTVLSRSGLGRAAAQRAGRGSAAARRRQCLAEATELVRQEAAKIFRNQWQHSSHGERRTLAVLAAADGQKENLPPAVSQAELDQRTLALLERRGLVWTAGASKLPGTAAAQKGSRPHQLFSELFREWILTNVSATLDLVVEDTEGNPTGRTLAKGPPLFSTPTTQVPVPERYSLLEEIGHGGAGTVFKARDDRLERVVAIKVLHREIRDSPERLKRLLEEARTCAALHHPHIVTIYDIDVERGFLVQEFLAGGSLRDLLEMVPVLPLPEVLSLAEQLGEALSAAHRAGVVHRDLKPENVLLAARLQRRGALELEILPTVKLADFGTALRLSDLSQVSERHSVAGTLAYMAPEQLLGAETGPAADFYALGVVLYEARRGVRPATIGQEEDPTADLPSDIARMSEPIAELDNIISRCLAESPKERFPTADEFLAAVRSARPSPT